MLTKTYDARFKAVKNEAGEPTGEIEFYASVFGNVDHIGDRVLHGAFDESLKSWRSKGEPIPVIFSHQWDNPFAIIGEANPNEVKADRHGLLVRAKLDIEDNPTAKQVYSLIKRGIVLESSFAYDVVKEKRNQKDGANDLEVLNLIEVGPTLKGMNPDTRGAIAKSGLFAALLKDMDPEEKRELVEEFRDYLKLEKAGRRNSSADQSTIQSMHDGAVALGAACGEEKSDESKTKAHEGEEYKPEEHEDDAPTEDDEVETKGDTPAFLEDEDEPEAEDTPAEEADETDDREHKPDEDGEVPGEEDPVEDEDKKSAPSDDSTKAEDAEAKSEDEEPSEDDYGVKRRAAAELLDIEAFLLD